MSFKRDSAHLEARKMFDFILPGCIWQDLMNCCALRVLSTGENVQEGVWKECRHRITLLQETYSQNVSHP